MAKLPKTQSKGLKRSPRVQNTAGKNSGAGKNSTGGKNLSLYMKNGSFNLNKRAGRRFSIVESSSSDSEDSSPHQQNANDSDSPSDSSLTAVSDNGISDKSSMIFEEDQPEKKNGKYGRKGKGKGKSVKGFGKKSWYPEDMESGDEDENAIESDEEQVFYDQEEFGDLGEDEEDDDSDSDSDSGSSSSDNSDVDFVKLQAQKKIRSMTPVAERKEAPEPKRRGSAVPKPRFGRRRSEAALPEDINFKFEFNDKNYDLAVEDSEEEALEKELEPEDIESGLELGNVETLPQPEEEDIGEEIGGLFLGQLNPTAELDLDFNNQLTQAPKFNYDDINSDDDYEIDDNELLATLQADNDMEEFNKSTLGPGPQRQGSVVSIEDDDENEFLKEEEKFLVNEFENNGFDEEEKSNKESEKKAGETFNQDSSLYDDYEEEDEEEEEEEDFIDFTINEDVSDQHMSPKKTKKIKSESDEEDDSYLWNYFFSSDNDSDDDYDSAPQVLPRRHKKSRSKTKLPQPPAAYDSFVGESDDPGYDSSETTDVDLNIPSNANNAMGSQKAKEVLSSKTADYRPPVLGTWVALETKPFGIIDGLSTRTLTGHPPNSARAPDTRDRQKPRKSVAVSDDSALGLDELLNMSDLDYDDTNDVKIWRDFNSQKQRVPLGAFRNKSLLENSLNQTSTDPITSNILYNHTSKTNNDYNQRRYSLSQHKGSVSKPGRRKSSSVAPVPSKLKRRRASKVEAFSEGYRPTKSGLFSEQALVDVEAVLGDDNDIMALIKGL